MFATSRTRNETSVTVSPLPDVADAVDVVSVDRERFPHLAGRYVLVRDTRTCRDAAEHVREIATGGQPIPATRLPRRQAG